jgi:glycosyltransferase involved in cell wall biosynthesis
MLSLIIPVGDLERDQEQLRKNFERLNFPTSLEIIVVFDFDTRFHKSDQFQSYLVNLGIKVVETDARNPNQARLSGFRAATHNYLVFCDSDDDINIGELTDLATTICELDTLRIYSFDSIQLKSNSKITRRYDANYLNLLRFPGLWRVVIPRKMLKSEFFIPTKMGEDLALLCGTLLNADKILFSRRKFYQYIQHSNTRLSLSRDQNVYFETVTEFTQLMRFNVRKVNFNAILAAGVYTSFVISTLKVSQIRKWGEVFRGLKVAILHNRKLGISMCLSLPLVCVAKFPIA